MICHSSSFLFLYYTEYYIENRTVVKIEKEGNSF